MLEAAVPVVLPVDACLGAPVGVLPALVGDLRAASSRGRAQRSSSARMAGTVQAVSSTVMFLLLWVSVVCLEIMPAMVFWSCRFCGFVGDGVGIGDKLLKNCLEGPLGGSSSGVHSLVQGLANVFSPEGHYVVGCSVIRCLCYGVV